MKVDIPAQWKAINYYEPDTQALLQMEECTGLVRAIGEMRRRSIYGADDSRARDALVESMAEALICMEQIQEIYDISNHELQYMINDKCAKMKEQILRR